MVILTNKIGLPVKLVVSISTTEHPSCRGAGMSKILVGDKPMWWVRNLFPLIGIGLTYLPKIYGDQFSRPKHSRAVGRSKNPGEWGK